jgi:hypothetical protein
MFSSNMFVANYYQIVRIFNVNKLPRYGFYTDNKNNLSLIIIMNIRKDDQ